MYSSVTPVNNTVLHIWKLLSKSWKFSSQGTIFCDCVWWQMLTRLVVMVSQYIQMSTHSPVPLKLIQCMSVIPQLLKIYLFLIEGQLLYNIVLVSAKHQHALPIGIHMSPLERFWERCLINICGTFTYLFFCKSPCFENNISFELAYTVILLLIAVMVYKCFFQTRDFFFFS